MRERKEYQAKVAKRDNFSWKKRNKKKQEKISRFCLRCDREFMALGKFIRICPECKNLHNIYYSSDITGGKYAIT